MRSSSVYPLVLLVLCLFSVSYAWHAYYPSGHQCRSCIGNPAYKYCEWGTNVGYCCGQTGEGVYVCLPFYEKMCSNTPMYKEEFAEYLVCPHEVNQCGIQYHDVKDTDSFYLETQTLLRTDSLCNYELYATSDFTGTINVTVEDSNSASVRVFKESDRYELLGLVEKNQSIMMAKFEFNKGQRYHVQVMSDGAAPHAKILVKAVSHLSSDKSETTEWQLQESEPSEDGGD